MIIDNIQTWQDVSMPSVGTDLYFIVSLDQLYDFEDLQNPDIIYSGYLQQGSSIKNINQIVAQHFKLKDLEIYPEQIITFDNIKPDKTIYIYYSLTPPGSTWHTIDNDRLTFVYNWSYQEYVPSLRSRQPITLLDYRQILPLTVDIYGSQEVLLTGSLNVDNRPVRSLYFAETYLNYMAFNLAYIYNWPIGGFNYGYSYGFDVTRDYMLPGTFADLTIELPDYFSYHWTVTGTCYKYALYYTNDIGGWDYMLFGGQELQTDQLSRLQYEQAYFPGSTQFGRTNYLTSIRENWTLNTSYIDDMASHNLMPLFSSNNIMLYELDTQKLIPVNITNSSVDHKTYKNQGRKLYAYNITVESAQDKYRL